jgi:hypothetical protein
MNHIIYLPELLSRQGVVAVLIAPQGMNFNSLQHLSGPEPQKLDFRVFFKRFLGVFFTLNVINHSANLIHILNTRIMSWTLHI